MSYSLDQLPNDPDEIPEPPLYAVWVEQVEWDWKTSQRVRKTRRGQVRNVPTLSKAKRRITTYATPYNNREKFDVDWAVYKWNGTKYELLFDGVAGEVRADNALYKQKVTKKTERTVRAKPSLDLEVEAALQSIAQAAG